ncbi:MAG: formylglycine-generating enzyme family protein [Phycisphaerales bacterium]
MTLHALTLNAQTAMTHTAFTGLAGSCCLISVAMIVTGCAGVVEQPGRSIERESDWVQTDTVQPPALAAPFEQVVPGTATRLTMIPLPPGGDIKPIAISSTEIPWEVYDVFVYQIDLRAEELPQGVDAITRPSKPYVPPDRGFGHDRYPAIGMTHHAAVAFCEWLSAHTGRKYRLPTEAEWEFAARAGLHDDAGSTAIDVADLQSIAWFDENADFTTHPVARKSASAIGTFDMLGNAAEWCTTADGQPVVRGGSYLDLANELEINDRIFQKDSWNASDPQIPKSLWWLADCSFVGFRVVCELE